MRPLHRLVFVCFALVFLFGVFSIAQNVASKPLIVEKVNENQLVMLRGNTPPAAIGQNDRGRVSAGMSMSGLVLVLRRSPEQQAAFDAFVASQYDATSPNYHHWLEPEEVGEKFGPAMADIATVSSWLSSHGLAVETVSKDRMTIRFSGTASQVEETFHTEIHNLVVKGEPHISNMSDPQIPMALDPVVLGPKALHNFTPRPLHRLGNKVALNRATGTWQRTRSAPGTVINVSSVNVTPRPDLGINLGSGANASVVEDLTPYDFATIYNVLPLWTAGTPIDGTGQTIAIAGTSNINLSDVANFRQIFGLPPSTPTVTYTGTGTAPAPCTGTTGNCVLDDQLENALDVEWSGAVAKGAKVVLVFTTPTATNDAVYDSSFYVVQNKTAPILNVSYGECELGLGTAGNTAYNSLWQSASTEGIAVFAASGDSGSPACDQGESSTTPYSANFGLSVSGVASTPFDTAVGGTDFQWCNPTVSANCASGSPYWGSSNNSTGGFSNNGTGANALGYIPEVPWNDTCTTPAGIAYIESVAAFVGGATVTNAESACNYILNNYVAINSKYGVDLSFFVNAQGAGGGGSTCTTSTGGTVSSCAGGYGKPSWQAGVTGIPGDGKRDIPDVSFLSAAGLWNSAYLICVSDAGTCLTSTSPSTEPIGLEIGGTSAASPAMAGVMALINQKAGSAQGSPNAELYVLAGKQTYSSCSAETATTSGSCYFNDIDKGTNAMPCTSGSPNCTVFTTGDAVGVINGYSAGVGYDEATGLGSLNVANVVNAWSAATGTAIATVAATATPSSILSNQSVSVAVTVTGSSGTPTGSVTLSGGGYTSLSQTLSAGSTTFTIPANSLSAGTDSLIVSYGGDSKYATGSGSASVTVTASVFALAATAPANISRGSSATSTITWSTTTSYSGTVTLSSCTLNSGAPANSAGDTPKCTVSTTAFGSSGSGTATVSTTAATTAALKRPAFPGVAVTGSGAILALMVFFGIPARRRNWRAMLGMLVLMLALGSVAACGGGGGSSSGGGGGTSDPGTASGQYVFTVTGTGNPAVTPAPTKTFTVVVN